MNIQLVPCENDKALCKSFKTLYYKSFPFIERAPYFMLLNAAKKGRADMLAAMDGDEFAGLLYMLTDGDIAYIFYLAVDEEKRGKGYGKAIISAMKERYLGKRIFLARERIEKNAENIEQRKNRRQFYLKNGFEDYDCFIREGFVVYAFMGIGGKVSAEEYDRLITRWIGKFITRLFHLEIIENNTGEYDENL